MTPIRLYKPATIDLTIDFPSTWDELSHADMEVVAMSYFDQSLTPVEVCLKLIENRLSQKQRSTIIPLISIEDLAMEYTGLVHFLIQGIDRTECIKLDIGTTPLPDFEDITVGAYEESDIALSQYISTGEATHLVDFLTAFYQLPKSGNSLPNHATMQACALCFIGCKSFLPKAFPLVFGGSGEKASTESAPDLLALTKLIHSGAGPKNGTRENIRRMPLKEFLFDCQLEAAKAPDVF